MSKYTIDIIAFSPHIHVPLISSHTPLPPFPSSPPQNPNQPPNYGTFVLICTPCQPPISLCSTLFTNLCCASMPRPRNRSLDTSIAYMLPHPPETSRTTSSAGCRLVTSCSKTARSLASRSAGGSSGVGGCAVAGELYCRPEIVRGGGFVWEGRRRAVWSYSWGGSGVCDRANSPPEVPAPYPKCYSLHRLLSAGSVPVPSVPCKLSFRGALFRAIDQRSLPKFVFWPRGSNPKSSFNMSWYLWVVSLLSIYAVGINR